LRYFCFTLTNNVPHLDKTQKYSKYVFSQLLVYHLVYKGAVEKFTGEHIYMYTRIVYIIELGQNIGKTTDKIKSYRPTFMAHSV